MVAVVQAVGAIVFTAARLGTVGQAISAALGMMASAPPRPSPDQVNQVLSSARDLLDYRIGAVAATRSSRWEWYWQRWPWDSSQWV